MHNIEMQEMSPEFLKCWKAAEIHLNHQIQGGIQSWIRAHPNPPILEHLSFRLGNQLFFIRVEDVERRVEGPGDLRSLILISDGCKGHACILHMKKRFLGDAWVAECNGWGLVDARTGEPVEPVMLISDQNIEMTDWELQDFAVQVVRDEIEKMGYQLMSSQGNPSVDPAIWFVGESKQPEWVVVRSARYPRSEVSKPENWTAIASGCALMSDVGHFAQVAFASVNQPFAGKGETPVPLWRGHGVYVRYCGLESGN